MTTFVNLAEMIERDNFFTPPVSKVSGQMYVSLSASNSNLLYGVDKPSTNSNTFLKFRDQGPDEFDFFSSNNTWWRTQINNTDAEGNFQNLGSLHILRVKLNEWR